MTYRLALIAALTLLPLVGCGPDLSTPEGQCRAQAYDDPQVKHIIQLRNDGNDHDLVAYLPAERDAVTDATRRCMQARGLVPKGGVERQKRDYD